MALSPFNEYTAAAIAYVLVIAFLVSIMLIGGLLVLNLSFMSRRKEDQIGARGPNDVGFLKHVVWPQAAYQKKQLPAEEDDYVDEDEDRSGSDETRPPKAA